MGHPGLPGWPFRLGGKSGGIRAQEVGIGALLGTARPDRLGTDPAWEQPLLGLDGARDLGLRPPRSVARPLGVLRTPDRVRRPPGLAGLADSGRPAPPAGWARPSHAPPRARISLPPGPPPPTLGRPPP